MKGLKGFASVIVILGFTVCAPRANAEIELRQEKFPIEYQVDRNQTTESQLEQGFDLFKTGDYREAIGVFSQVIQIEPNNPYAYLGRGTTYLVLNDCKKAKADLDRSIRLDASIPYAYLFRGLSNYGLGSKHEAIYDLRVANNLFEKKGDKELAQKSLETIKRIQNS